MTDDHQPQEQPLRKKSEHEAAAAWPPPLPPRTGLRQILKKPSERPSERLSNDGE